MPSGERHELCRGIHAEQNVLLQAAAYGTSTRDSTIYCNTYPCSICAKMIINAEIREVIYEKEYEDELAKTLFDEAGIVVHRFTSES